MIVVEAAAQAIPAQTAAGVLAKLRMAAWYVKAEPAATDDADEIFIETVTSYWIPHSVTAWCVTVENDLYVAADYADKKRWVANVARNPNVRLKIKDKVYEQKLVPVTDATTIASIDSGFVRKYEYEEEEADEDMTVGYWRVVERD